MRLVITDTSELWKTEDKVLEQFRRILLVVCLKGEPITSQYKCLICPYQNVQEQWEDHLPEGISDLKLLSIISAGNELYNELNKSRQEDIVFLTDDTPSTLYPFYIMKNANKYRQLHMITIHPPDFADTVRKQEYYRWMSDLSTLNSLLVYRASEDAVDYESYYLQAKQFFDRELVAILNRLYDHRYEHTYFDFASMSYVSIKEGFDRIDLSIADKLNYQIDFPLRRNTGLLGRIVTPRYPENYVSVKSIIEEPSPRIDGKILCSMLRQQRLLLAQANHIAFESEECPSVGACAGFCEKCDCEAEYLREQLSRIPKEQQVYPSFDPEMTQ